MMLVGLAAWGALVLTAAAGAQTPAPGRLVEHVTCPTDATQTYTLYLPAAYQSNRKWPLLFVFDPRGRGTLAAERFRAAAERFGWIVASADGTRSDGPWEPNQRAIAALWPDVLRAYAVDERRIYAAGFSGGAGVAWALQRATNAIAGVIASSAPNPGTEAGTPKFAWFGAAGRTDFNFLEAKAIDERMARTGNPHRLEFFDGAHEWLPAPLAVRAAGWLEVLAMKSGTRPVDPRLAGELLAADMDGARALEAAGSLTDAQRAYSSIAETYAGVVDPSEARDKARALQADDRVRRAKRDEQRADDRQRATMGSFGEVLTRLYRDDIPSGPQLRSDLRIAALSKTASGTSYEAAAARRSLEQIFVQTSFYVWRDFEEKREYARAALLLEMSLAIHADRPALWLALAGDRAMSGARSAAIEALGRAIDCGFDDKAALLADQRFAALRNTPAFEKLLQRIAGYQS